MTTVEARSGDVFLVDHGAGAGPVSRLIMAITESPFSHTVLCLGEGRYVDASPDAAAPDISPRTDDGLETSLEKEPAKRYVLLRSLTPPDAGALSDAVDLLQRRAADAGDPILFSDGALAGVGALTVLGVGLLRTLDALPEAKLLDVKTAKLRAALFYALEDGDRRLFCSEFVHRALTAAGARPALPLTPVVDLSGYPTDEPGLHLFGWMDGLRMWLQGRWDDLVEWVLAKVELDRNTFVTFDEVWDRVLDAYRRDLAPAQLTVANFFTPEDFHRSPSFQVVAERRAGTGWRATTA